MLIDIYFLIQYQLIKYIIKKLSKIVLIYQLNNKLRIFKKRLFWIKKKF